MATKASKIEYASARKCVRKARELKAAGAPEYVFETFSVTKAVTHVGGGLVAKNERFEVYASRRRVGEPGRRSYHVSFTAIEVLSREPRKTQEVVLPDTCRSDLKKILAFLEEEGMTS